MDGMCMKKNSYSLVIILSIIGGCALIGIAIYLYCKLRKWKSDAKYEHKEELDFEERARESSEIHRLSVPKFEEIEEMIK
jgi:flagellar basal body-associated protein FliL